MPNRSLLLSTTALATVLFMAQPALAADRFETAHGLPAVSGPNGKLAAFGGSIADGESAYGVVGAFATPMGHAFGLQIDGMVGHAADAAFYGGAAHLFWRDPSKGLIGFYGSYTKWDTGTSTVAGPVLNSVIDVGGAEVGKLGVEAEAYLGQVSVEGGLAYQFGTETGLAGHAILAYYPHVNVRLDGGLKILQGPGLIGTLGAEWSPGGSNMSVFADGSIGGDGYAGVLGGVKVFFGEHGKSLIRRHREDDPEPTLPDDLFMAEGDEWRCEDGSSFDGDFCVPL